ncbi:MAG TPA: hypothetical protein VIK13_05050 [Candidatus Limnocylindrales bacterium]
MSRVRRVRRAHVVRIVLIALVSLLALPGSVFAADPVTLSGTVMRDGTPVAGVEVAVTVDGSDLILSATSGADGTFSLAVDAGIGSQVALRATGPTTVSGPGEDGCVHRDTPIGSATLTLETLTPDPVALSLDQVISSIVCSATGRPDPTVPPTDGVAQAGPQTPGGGAGLAVLGILAALAGVSLATVRSPGRRPGA